MNTPNHTTPDGNVSHQSQPLWRKHFPVESDADAAQSRRGFLGGVAVAGGAMACCQAAITAGKSVPIPENRDKQASSSWTEYKPLVLEKKIHELVDGEALLFHFPDHRSPCLLVKFSNDDFVAYSQKCTHLACPVIPEFEQNEFHCPCHHGVFDLRTGEPKSGPPRRPLVRVRVERGNNGTLRATGMET